MSLRLLLPVVALLSLGGCIVRTPSLHPPKTKKSGRSSSECHPSQSWDGEQCRHKGKGKGARKHDG
ncbi:MAG: hypothetical protein JXB05_35725 [Myxococcaceae bacterium]|nr:hypothetical protein [Myxococcaceae bacterium]